VIVRGNKGQRVFRREADFKLYLRLLGEYKEVFEFVLCAYALIPTHVHLLVEARDKPLSGLMQRVQHLAGAAGVKLVSSAICIWRHWRGF
jgi:REP element-mobilizing transposase RayT